MQEILSFFKEFCTLNSFGLRALACFLPLVAWKFTFPEHYYEMQRVEQLDAIVDVMLPLLIISMFWEFIKFRREKAKSNKSDFDG